jgi:beta-glucosidase
MDMNRFSNPAFPPGFTWGAATAAFQIEGATTLDGRGESIWDRFAASPGNVLNGDTGDPACDHYHRWADDLDLIQSLGLHGYRFSIAWPRVQPSGRGPANQRGLDFYRRLVEGMHERGIRPYATLYHWDLPQALQDEGGWVERDTVARYCEYAELVFDALGDVVEDWITHNEPWVAAFLGYGMGVKAPGIRDWRSALRACHHILLSHGRTVEAFRAHGRAGRIGLTLDLTPCYGDPGAAARMDGYRNRWFLEPVLRGAYPQDMVELYEPLAGPIDCVEDGDLATISTPNDFLGVNFYHPTRVSDGADEPAVLRTQQHPAEPVTGMGWEVQPQALVDLLTRLKAEYPNLPPIFITENGAAYDDHVNGADVVEDPERTAYVRSHLDALAQAIAAGVDVRGYFVWSLLDNFEWELGYGKRFGIVYVDYETQQRIPKRSALWYRDFVAGLSGGTPAALRD